MRTDTTNGEGAFYMVVRNNAIDNPLLSPPATTGVGQYAFNQLLSIGAGINIAVPVGNNGSQLWFDKNQADYPVVYNHMGNIYSAYRVLSSAMTLSLGQVFQSPDVDHSLQSSPPLSILNVFATDDVESINTGSLIPAVWMRPFNRSHRYTKQATVSTVYGKHDPTMVRQSVRVKTLIKDQAAFRNGQYDGTCVRNVSGGIPTYNPPAQFTYQGFLIHPYGGPVVTSTNTTLVGTHFPNNTNCFTGYISVTQTVKFFKPHDNADFYGPV